MFVIKTVRIVVAAILTSPFLLTSAGSWGQQQVLEEVGAAGRNTSGNHGVVRPDFDVANTYTNWVAPAAGRDFRAFAISVSGTALVLDGNTIREYTSAGAVKVNAGFPVNCTTLPFQVTKPNGSMQTAFLSECGTFTPLNNGTIRIAGKINGGGFVIIEYNPATGLATLKADGTPPSISDMDGDQFADAVDRKGPGYWAVGDRKKVIFFSLDPSSTEQAFTVVATLNGVRIDSVTPFGPNRVIVALDTGELRWINTNTGAATSFASLPTGTACGLGNKDPQKFTVRATPLGRLFVANLGCRTVTVFGANLTQISPNAQLAQNPFLLNSPAPFSPVALDWQSGVGGDFADCQGGAIAQGCQVGVQQGQAVIWNVRNLPGADTTFRMFQFVDLVDCRWSGDRPCPIVNCPQADVGGNEASCPAVHNQVLDLAQLLVRADPTGDFVNAAFGDPPSVPVMAIPGNIRAERCFPTAADPNYCLTAAGDEDPSKNNNNFRFNTFFAVNNAVFTGNFLVDYQIDQFRNGSADPCVIPASGSKIAAINETANLIVYNSDSFGTINRGGAQETRGGTIINSFCNGGGSGHRWSSQSIGLELYDLSPDAYVKIAGTMMNELIQAKRELVCAEAPHPENPPALLGSTDCNAIQGQLDQTNQKLDTCLASLYASQQGNSAENCNAFFTKTNNLQSALNAAAWPNPFDPQNLEILRPNYEGEMRSRLASLVFFVQSYALNSVPPGGIVVP